MTDRNPDCGIARRDVLAAMVASGAIGAVSLGAVGRLLAAAGGDVKTIVRTGFEKTDPAVKATAHKIVTGVARTGERSLMGQVSGANQANILDIPFKAPRGGTLGVSFRVRGDSGSACTVWVRQGRRRERISMLTSIPTNTWAHVEASKRLEAGAVGTVQIVAPSSWGGCPAGKAWIDDLAITLDTSDRARPEALKWPAAVEGFPALACDASGGLWLAVLERGRNDLCIRVFRMAGGQRKSVCALRPEGLTGIGPPAIVGAGKGVAVAFAVEQNDRWRIAWAMLDGAVGKSPARGTIECDGRANISPALAATGADLCAVWESNAGKARGIYACKIARGGQVGKARRISHADANAYNPAIVPAAGGKLFAAWDTLRDGSADIYGAWCIDGKWQAPRRLTSDGRIERHPSLAVHGGQLWMAWQAQGYHNRALNNLSEQRIVVARITPKRLEAPLRLFEDVSSARRSLMRPRIAFDGQGRLWLTARQGAPKRQAGWTPAVWCYTGGAWSAGTTLLRQEGRWHGAAMAFVGEDQAVSAGQFDDLPGGWDSTRGKYRNWRSGVMVGALPTEAAPAAAPLKTRPLKMPETDFAVRDKIALCSADLPRQAWRRGGRDLVLLWGDFHDHTDISVCNRRWNPPGHDLYANLRDIEKLDFCAATDHGYNFDPPQWALNGEQTRNNHDAGRFITFLGEEWTSSKTPPAVKGKPRRYGHRNLIFLDPYHREFHDSFDGDISPAELWKKLAGTEFICIPHQLADWRYKGGGNPPTDWDFVDEKLQPVAEIFQARQSYEYLGCPRQAPHGMPVRGYYLQDAWAAGIVIGVIASPDHGGGSGKMGVWAAELTRQAIFDAVRARHTYGTSGAKMALRFSAGDAMMGDKVARPGGAIRFDVEALAMHEVREAVIFRNNRIVHRAAPGRKQFKLTWTDNAPPKAGTLWYYARIQAADDELAWSSPIWFTA